MAKIKLGKVLDTHRGYNIRVMMVGGKPTNQAGVYKGKNWVISGKLSDLGRMKKLIDEDISATEKQRRTDRENAEKESKKLREIGRRTW